jgi:ATP-dependent RNA helicase DHX57
VRPDATRIRILLQAREALVRKGFAGAAVDAALVATAGAALAAGDAAQPFNEQRRRRSERALEHLLLHLPEAELPKEYRSGRAGAAAKGTTAASEPPPPPDFAVVAKPTQATAKKPPLPNQQKPVVVAGATAGADALRALRCAGYRRADAEAALATTRNALQPALALLAARDAPDVAAARAAAHAAVTAAGGAALPDATLLSLLRAARVEEIDALCAADAAADPRDAYDAAAGPARGNAGRDAVTIPADFGYGAPGEMRLDFRDAPWYPFQPPAVACRLEGAPDAAAAAATAAAAAAAAEAVGRPMLLPLARWLRDGGGAAAASEGAAAEMDYQSGADSGAEEAAEADSDSSGDDDEDEANEDADDADDGEDEEALEECEATEEQRRRVASLLRLCDADVAPDAAPPQRTGAPVRAKGREEVAALRAASAAEAARLVAEEAAAHAAADALDAEAASTRLTRAAVAAEAEAATAAASGAAAAESARMLAALRARRADPAAAAMLAARARLPAASCAAALVAAVRNHQVVLVAGSTGCGKTTQCVPVSGLSRGTLALVLTRALSILQPSRLPQFVLDDAIEAGAGAGARLLCTQPRRVAAVSVAERVASERCEKVGDAVGYKIRLEAAAGPRTRLLYCTTGVALRRLAEDPALKGVSHVVVDEVHERSLDTDLLLALLRDVLPARPSLRLVLMSATLDADAFASYFRLPKSAVVCVPGFTFPVRELYLEDALAATGYLPQRGGGGGGGGGRRDRGGERGPPPADEAAALRRAGYSADVAEATASAAQERVDYELLDTLLAHICDKGDPGSILVFLPGLAEIAKARELASANASIRAATRGGALLLPLHSALGSGEQRAVFDPAPPGMRKVVLATNIAETSITIDDVVHVVDAGRVKETGFEPATRMATLLEGWVSQASAQQRRGRAGRTRPGVCWRLFSRATAGRFVAQSPPEVLRVPLESALLSATRIAPAAPGGAAALLARLPAPPPRAAVDAAAAALRQMGAFDARNALTPLGVHLAALPLDPRVGKMLIYAALLRCVGPALTVAAVFGGKSPFVSPLDRRDEADAAKARFAAGSGSDHLAAAAAFDAWAAARKAGRKVEAEFVRDAFVSARALEGVADARRQCASLLSQAGLLGPQPRRGARGGGGGRRDDPADCGIEPAAWAAANANAGDLRVLRAVLVAGLYPNLARAEAGAKPGAPPKLVCRDAPVALHPCCVAHGLPALPTRWLVFLERVQTGAAFLRDATPVGPYALLLFGGALTVRGDVVAVDGWAEFKAPPRVAVLFGALRRRLDALLADKVARPGADVAAASAELVQALVALLASEPDAPPLLAKPQRAPDAASGGNKAKGGGKPKAKGKGRR